MLLGLFLSFFFEILCGIGESYSSFIFLNVFVITPLGNIVINKFNGIKVFKMAVSNQKHALRTLYKQTRKDQLPLIDQSLILNRVMYLLEEFKDPLKTPNLSSYYPIPDSGEIDVLTPLITNEDFTRNFNMCLPVVVQKAQPLIFRSYKLGDTLQSSIVS